MLSLMFLNGIKEMPFMYRSAQQNSSNSFSFLTTLVASTFLSVGLGCANHATSTKTTNDDKGPQAEVKSASAMPVEDFFKNPLNAGYQISPDGKMISFLAPYQGRMNVFVRSIDLNGEPKRVTDVTDRDVSGYIWKGAGTILYLRDFNGDENYQVFAVDLKTLKTTALTPFPKVRTELLDDLRQIDNDHILVGLNKRNPEIFDVYRLNIHDGKLDLVAENPGNIANWITDHKGKIRAAITSDGVNQTLLVRDNEKLKFRPLVTTTFRESVSPFFYTFDNKNIYAASNRGRDKSAIVTLDVKTGKEKVFFQDPEVDMQNLSYSKKRHVLWTAVYSKDKTERHFFDKQIESVFNEMRAQLPGLEVGIAGNDDDETKFLVVAYSDTQRGLTYIYDAKSKKMTKLAEGSPWLKPELMSEMKPISYQSRDGLTIHGYLTVPRGMPAKNLPVVVNPHGGPWVRDHWGFNSEAQFLASRGYAVFQPNYRGSTGYGRKFWEASFKEWGKKMQDDITDGVGWMVKEGIANPKRVGIYGGSYGGYATLAGLAFTPDLYACGIDYVGVSNLFTFMKTIPPYWKPFLAQMHEQVGDPEKDIELLKAASPVFHVDQIKVPLFVAQGAKDPRVNIAESNQIVDALRKRGVTVQYLVKENEGHGFHNEENRFDFYRAMEKFLKEHL